jgi:hypothetical protein
MRYARHRPEDDGRKEHSCKNCQHSTMVQAFRRARADEEDLHENGGPKPTLTFRSWLQNYWEPCG